MSQLVFTAYKQAQKAINNAFSVLAEKGELKSAAPAPFTVEVPADRSNGDLSSNAAMVNARTYGCAPAKIAAAICSAADLTDTYFERCEPAGPGFINFYYKSGFNALILKDIRAHEGTYGRSDHGGHKKVLIEFVSANPTGPMHMGNARGGALGDCLAAVMDRAGYDVQREFYINDAGNQIDKFALSLDIRYQQIFLGDNAPQLPEDSYHGDDIAQLAKEFADINGDSFMDETEQIRRRALVDYALPKNIENMHKTLDKYRIHYDTWFKESVLHEDGELDDVLELMKDKGLTFEKDGALWYKATEHGGEKDEVLVRANGTPTYFAADIAYHRNKFEKRGFDKCIDVWGADHHGHVARLKGALNAIGVRGDDLDIVLMQLVRLTQGGQVVRMSKRTGKAITLTDLLDDIPVDAARFLFNMREPGSQMEFDLDLAVKQSAENPVYYCQYAHARICSILSKLKEDGIEPRECTVQELEKLTAPEEKALIDHLASFTAEINAAADSYDPARITRYCITLASLFHKFYNACRVRCDDESLMQSRIYLCICVKNVIHDILTMFNITVPEHM